MKVTRDVSILQDELNNSTHFNYAEKLRLAIEYFIAQLPSKQQAAAWQELPYLVQFGPILAKWGKYLPDVRLVNPGITYGGLTEYDKDAVYNKLPEVYTLASIEFSDTVLPSYEQMYSACMHIGFPCMKKAIAGERGVGVYYIENEDALKTHYMHMSGGGERVPSSIQTYATYKHEYCLQFYQYYDQANIHRIVYGGLTQRVLPIITGDGIQTVQELITHSTIAPHHQKNIINNLSQTNVELLENIPHTGEEVDIVFIASIDYGTVYKHIILDPHQEKKCCALITDILQDITPEYMSVGRFDLKANNIEELLNGHIEIIECNAAGGIPTHVYSQHFSIQEKYEELDKHFSIMMRIADGRRRKYTALIDRLISWPEFLAASYQSLTKKGIDVLAYSPEKNKELKKIRKEIFRILRISRWSRWKARAMYVLRKLYS